MATNKAAGGHPRPGPPPDASAAMSVMAAIGMVPLVGRRAERELIAARLAASTDGPGCVIVISGTPGVGKTRLAVAAAAGLDRTVIRLHCDEHLRNVPYLPFLDPRAGLGNVASLLASPLPDADSTSARLDMFEDVDRLIVQRAGETPCILLLDQLEWIDAASVDVLRYLVRRGRAVLATMRVGTSRIDSPLGQLLADWNHERLLLEVPLAPLGRPAADELVAHLLGPVDRDLGEAIHSRTDGHPFLVEEFVRFLVTEGYVSRREGMWCRSDLAFPSEGEVSFGITAAVLRRHDHLPSKTRQALRAASVLGAQCPLSLLAALVESTEADLIDDLAPAIALRIFWIERQGAGDHPTHGGFTLTLLRDAHYASLTREDRRTLHRRAAEMLAPTAAEPPFGRISSTDAALLAYHAEQAHAWELAHGASPAAGDQAVSGLAAPGVPANTGTSSPVLQPLFPMGLSGREVEVLRLVADGLTNSQIAERLFLSPKTVSSHLVSIFDKLGVSTRTRAARFAIEHDLL